MTNAQNLTEAQEGRWFGQYGSAPCPVCQPQGRKDQNALTLADGADGRLLLHCKKAGCSFHDIIAATGFTGGNFVQTSQEKLKFRESARRAELKKKARQAQRAWEETQPICGTIGETYLREARGITCALPATLRFHPSCWHISGQRLPAMIALVEGGKDFAVHRTYLRSDGSGKAEVKPNKMMLGSVSGGAVRLTYAQNNLVIAEGIETALSLSCGLLCPPSNVWAALSTSGVRGLHLPHNPGELIVAPDGDPAGRSAANDLAGSAHALGWKVSLLPIADGLDWNDILKKKGETA